MKKLMHGKGRSAALFVGGLAAIAATALPASATETTPTLPTIDWGAAAQQYITSYGSIFGILLPFAMVAIALMAGWGLIKKMVARRGG